jgi:hypothetical protein
MTTTTKANALHEQGEGQSKSNYSKPKHTPFALRLKALLIGIAAYDAALLALLFLLVWGALR